MPEHNLVRMPFLIIPLILAALVGFSSGFVTINLPAEVECPEGTIKTQFGNNFECLTKQEPASGGVLPIPTPSPIPTSKPQVAYKQPETTPRPTDKPQVESTPQPTTDPDPITNCKAHPDTHCAGQSLRIRKSECLTRGITICCQTNSGWRLLSTGECKKTQDLEIASQRRAIEGNTDKMEETRRRANDLIEKSRKDFEDFRKQSSSDIDQFIQKSRDDFKRATDDTDKSIAEAKARIKQSEERQKKEFYDMCVGIVNDKYSNKSGGIIGQSGGVSGGVYYGTENRAYQDELSGCNSLLK